MRAVDFVGIDIGSTYAKVAVLDEAGRPALMEVLPSGWNSVETAGRIWELLKASKVDTAQMYCTATGYGRGSVAFADRAVTEITCHGKGAAWLFGKGSFRIIDIGGQDTKVIAMENGTVKDFLMNDKCAAGTGRFLEVMAGSLGVSTEQLYQLAAKGTPTPINSMCAVFAESEVIGLMGKGAAKEDIACGIVDSIAEKVKSQCGRMTAGSGGYCMTGGLSDQPFFVERLSEKLKQPVLASRDGRYAGALGAALIGYEKYHKEI